MANLVRGNRAADFRELRGQLAGALPFSWMAEKFGRVRSATAASGADGGNSPALFVCRLIQGVGVGGEMPVAATYISELSKAHGRGRFFLLYELIFPVRLMATGQLGAWLVPLLGCQLIFWIGAARSDHYIVGSAPAGIAPLADFERTVGGSGSDRETDRGSASRTAEATVRRAAER